MTSPSPETPTVGDVEVARYALRTFRPMPGPDNKQFLTSVSMSQDDWVNGICSAICRSGHDHAPPFDGCSCGIYGTLDLPHLMTQYLTYAEKVVTVIAAEGTTVIGDRGLRTAHARVVAYWVNPNDDTGILSMCQQQFASADIYTDRDAMLATYEFPVDQFLTDEPLKVPKTFQECTPTPNEPSTMSLTIKNPPMGIYRNAELADGIIVPIGTLTINKRDCHVVLTINWVPPLQS